MVLPGTLAQQALAVVVEPLAAGRRVAVFGDATAGLDAILLDQGARAVSLFDPDPTRALAAADLVSPGVSVHAYGDDEPRSVDLAIVADLGLFADPEAVVARARRMVGDYGFAVFAASNADARAAEEVEGEGAPEESHAFDYYDLFDLVANEFHAVKMVARLPFFGVALMELGSEDDAVAAGVNVDTRLAEGGRTPEGFVVVASQGAEGGLPPYSIVELPIDAAEEAVAEEEEEGLVDEAIAEAPSVPDEAMLLALSEAQLRAEALAGDLVEMRARVLQAEAALQGLRTLETEAAEQSRRAASLERESMGAAEGHAMELGRLEEGLRERARTIRTLEGEVERRDRMVRDLVSALDDAGVDHIPAPEPVPAGEPARSFTSDARAEFASGEALVALRARLDALALDLAHREGEAHASAWKIEELERKLAHTSSLGAETGAPATAGPGSTTALDEIDALRQALVQEHDARVRAESGDELVQLRAEIARQAVLLDQLRPGEAPSEAGHEVSR